MKFPKMTGCDNCGDCCGPVSATPRELEKIEAFVARKGVRWQEHINPLTCGFHDTASKRCRVYKVRPASCRMYGVVREMSCPRFPDAASISLPAKDAFRRGIMSISDRHLAYVFGGNGVAALALDSLLPALAGAREQDTA